MKKVVYYIDSYYERMEDLNYLGYTKDVLFKNSDIYTISNLDTLISASVPYKRQRNIWQLKGTNQRYQGICRFWIQTIKSCINRFLSRH